MVEEKDWHPSDVTVLKNLVRLGSDLDRVREIDHFFYLPSRQSAEKLSIELSAIGHVQKGIDEDDDNVVLQTEEQSSPNNVTRNTQKLIELSKVFGGLYDGWGTTA